MGQASPKRWGVALHAPILKALGLQAWIKPQGALGEHQARGGEKAPPELPPGAPNFVVTPVGALGLPSKFRPASDPGGAPG